MSEPSMTSDKKYNPNFSLPIDNEMSSKHPKEIERMFETFYQSPSGDFRPSFYNPFEIKHRRRTTKEQYQVLESAFKENNKPNASSRRQLAAKLGMTPRAVQVWFQNRRAKSKTQNSGKAKNATQDTILKYKKGQDSISCDRSRSNSFSEESSSHYGLGDRRLSMPDMKQKSSHLPFQQLHQAIFGASLQQRLRSQMSMPNIVNVQSKEFGYNASHSLAEMDKVNGKHDSHSDIFRNDPYRNNALNNSSSAIISPEDLILIQNHYKPPNAYHHHQGMEESIHFNPQDFEIFHTDAFSNHSTIEKTIPEDHQLFGSCHFDKQHPESCSADEEKYLRTNPLLSSHPRRPSHDESSPFHQY